MSAPRIPEDVEAAAIHGSWCPKLCSHACPVLTATGRSDTVPWSFHRAVADTAAGRLPVGSGLADQLAGCTGCHACRTPCLFDQDVPAQVRAGRAVVPSRAWPAAAAVEDAAGHGRSPYGDPTPDLPPADDAADTTLVAGCRDTAEQLDAAVRLLRSAGRRVAVVAPYGCCGALLDDLGRDAAAGAARARLADQLPEGELVSTDPHCLPSVRAATGRTVTPLVGVLAELAAAGRLQLSHRPDTVTFHDPCLLARDEGVTDPPRALLQAAGADLAEPEGHGVATVCSGAGMGYDLLAPEPAATVAQHRARQLGVTGGAVVTACSRARVRLGAAGIEVADLYTYLADRLEPR